MADYVKSTNFTAKDSLPSGNSGKIVKGAEIDTELTAVASAIASKANINSPSLTGTPTAPTAASGTNTTQLATTGFVQSAIGTALSGVIVMWSGSIATIPSGWVLCNGSNGTPDLRNRFIIGAHSDVAGVANTTVTGSNTTSGGSKDAIVVSHTHTATSTVGNHSHDLTLTATTGSPTFGSAAYSALNQPVTTRTATTSSASLSISTSISTEGSSGTDANLPPYYALAFIMKT